MNRQELIEHVTRQTAQVNNMGLYNKVLIILNKAQAPLLDHQCTLVTDIGGRRLSLAVARQTSNHTPKASDGTAVRSLVTVEWNQERVLEIEEMFRGPTDDPLEVARSFIFCCSSDPWLRVKTYTPGEWVSILCSKELETFAEELGQEKYRESIRKRETEQARRPLTSTDQDIAKKFGL
jgi:hypothetical protein